MYVVINKKYIDIEKVTPITIYGGLHVTSEPEGLKMAFHYSNKLHASTFLWVTHYKLHNQITSFK